jgi:hypothetical protein
MDYQQLMEVTVPKPHVSKIHVLIAQLILYSVMSVKMAMNWFSFLKMVKMVSVLILTP